MINEKYYADMQAFPQQFLHIYTTSIPSHYPQQPRIIVCGMWGSALYLPLVQDLLIHHGLDIRLESCSSYTLPPYDKNNTVVICASHSGNTEETISCFHEARKQNAFLVTFTSGWQLMNLSTEHHIPTYQIPTGLQPRLSTGYFVTALLDLLEQLWYSVQFIQDALRQDAIQIDTQEAQKTAQELLGKTPIVYTTDVMKSMSLISKIKLNENSKTPAFAHYIPELNHNEMCGRMWHTMHPYFIIFTSQFTHARNLRRIKIMKELFEKEGYSVQVITPQWTTLEAEALRIYQFIDYVTYFLAEAQGTDPEPVQMVENFKKMLG